MSYARLPDAAPSATLVCAGRPGPMWRATAPVTTKTIVRLLDELHAAFGAGYAFAVDESAREGVVEMSAWPGRAEGMAKSVRLSVVIGDGSWPRTPRAAAGTTVATAAKRWREDKDAVVIWSPAEDLLSPFAVAWTETPLVTGGTFAKSRGGAPAWTDAELGALAAALCGAGMACRMAKRARKGADVAAAKR